MSVAETIPDLAELDLPPVRHRAGRDHGDWFLRAITILDDEKRRSADTNLRELVLPRLEGISIFLKDESTHPTGSLKHRLARSLFYDGICSGAIKHDTVLVEASSGSTAVSEAYFARLLGLRFVAVMPGSTSPQKITAIERFGGRCHLVGNPTHVYAEAARLARESGGYYLDQFSNASRVSDWRSDNVAQSMLEQFGNCSDAVPDWVVMGVGTGGTSATIGRYLRYRKLSTRLCVVDVERSAFFDSFVSGDCTVTSMLPSRIEGVGRQRVEPSFVPGVVDKMLKIPDAASIAAMRVLSERLYRTVGGSTGANFFGVCHLAAEMLRAGRRGSLVTLLCDGGERYQDTYYNDPWLKSQNIVIEPYVAKLNRFLDGFDVR
jgi:cysteine synthase A